MKIELDFVRVYFLFLLIFFSSFQVSAKEQDKDVQSVIHLLDYISRDYVRAIRDGEIINVKEYREMEEFSVGILDIAQRINFPKNTGRAILSNLQNLESLVQSKADAKDIKELVEKVKWAIIKATNYEVAPLNWPNNSNGQKLYFQNCLQCHGPKNGGEGKMARKLHPSPTNFFNDSLMAGRSAMEIYNTVKLGVEGTAMPAFTGLTDQEAWDLAFYVKSLRFQKQKIDSASLKNVFEQEYGKISLKNVAILSDNQLIKKLSPKAQSQLKLKALRIFSPSEELQESSLSIAKDFLQQSLISYKSGKWQKARQKALAAYLEGIEPVEVRLKTNDPQFTSQLEQEMMDVRQAIEQRRNPLEVEKKIKNALSTIERAEKMMRDEKLNYWFSFFLAASIMLREGLEAFLIIALILAIISSTPGAKKALPFIHAGWLTAIIMGVAGWFLTDWIINISGQNREIMEGLISLVAVIILGFVGFWLHNHSYSKQWKEFIGKKIGTQLKGEKMMGLTFFSFIVVFREAFESILFLKAISLETKSGDQSSIGFGVIAAFTMIGLLAFLFINYSKKIPVSQLFRYSSWVITLLVVILVGKGVHSFQEAGWLSVTGFPLLFKIDWLGIYPTLESVISQMILLGILMALYSLSIYKNRVKRTN